MKLEGKKALITGATRSIGRSIALAYAKEGADVVISYRSDQRGVQDTALAIEKLGRKATAIQADFSNLSDVESCFNKALECLGTLDLLVNNAASYDTTDFLNLEIKVFDHLLKVGVSAPLYLAQLASKRMIQEKKGGSILNVSSISGLRPYPNRTAHSTAKAALNMLTQSLALELGPHKIRVNAIAPGSTPYEKNNEMSSDIPLSRLGLPEDQASAAVFLASDEASWITGQVLVIDGGYSLSF